VFLETMGTRRKTATTREATSDIKSAVNRLVELTRNTRYYITDPAGLSVFGAVEFEKPVPIPRTVRIDVYDRRMLVVVDTKKLFLKRVEFNKEGYYKVEATFISRTADETDVEVFKSYYSYVEGVTLLYHENPRKEILEGRAKIEGDELKEFLMFVDAAIDEVVRSGSHAHISPKDALWGSDMLWVGWDSVCVLTDYTGLLDEDFIGLEVRKERDVYLALFDAALRPVALVGIDYFKESMFKISSTTLSRLPVAQILARLADESAKVVNDYLELAKIVRLGVGAYAV